MDNLPTSHRNRKAAGPLSEGLDRLRADLVDALPEAIADALHRKQCAGPPLLDAHDVAERLNVSKRTVERLVAGGDLRPLRIKGQRRFTPQAIDAYLRDCAGGRGAAR